MREHFNDGVEFARFLAHRFVTPPSTGTRIGSAPQARTRSR
ncbi:hypothetical protein, partial [Pseudomonas aeruginosa]